MAYHEDGYMDELRARTVLRLLPTLEYCRESLPVTEGPNHSVRCSDEDQGRYHEGLSATPRSSWGPLMTT